MIKDVKTGKRYGTTSEELTRLGEELIAERGKTISRNELFNRLYIDCSDEEELEHIKREAAIYILDFANSKFMIDYMMEQIKALKHSIIAQYPTIQSIYISKREIGYDEEGDIAKVPLKRVAYFDSNDNILKELTKNEFPEEVINAAKYLNGPYTIWIEGSDDDIDFYQCSE